MIHKLLSVLLLSLLASTAIAQEPPAPTPEPPYLDEPDHWEIHGPNGATGFEFTAEYWYSDEWCDVYVLEITGEVNGQPYSNVAVVFDCGDGTTLDVWNGDSGNWTTWVWRSDHYKKQGGTNNVRTYHPVYE